MRHRLKIVIGGLVLAAGLGGARAQTGYQYEQLAADPVLKTPATLDSMIMRAGYEQRHRDCVDAGLHTDAVLALKPNWAGARALRLHCEREEHRRVDELDDLNRLIRLQPAKPLWWSDRANVHHLDGDWKAALADLTHTMELRPWDDELYARRSQWEDEIQDYANAFSDLEGIHRLLPEQAAPLVAMAEYAKRHGRSESDVARYLKLAEMGSPKPEDSPRDDDKISTEGMGPDELMLRGGYAKSLGKWALELRFLNAALELQPGLVRALEMRLELGMGRVYLVRTSYSTADAQVLERLDPLQDVSRLIFLDARRADYYRYRVMLSRGLMLTRLVRDQILKDLGAIIQLEPNEGAGYAGRGQFEQSIDSLDAAVKDFMLAIELDPSNSEYPYELSLVYKQKRAFLTEALALNWALVGEPENARWLEERSKLP